ncbi:fibro-slime domain-containing protein [Ruminococcus sp. OM05-10BH]|nr:fibro-slime domain-containing protein [Ruminococcus sp. OM05-10BH]
MKSKRRKRVIASVLCMVLMLSTGMSTLAEADAGIVPAVEETTAAQTTAQETKSTSTDAQTAETETQTQTETETQTETKQTEEAAQTKQEETTAAQPTEEASSGETTQTETDQTAQNTQDQTTSAETSGTETQNETVVETQPEETETTTPAEETQETKEEAGVSPAFSASIEAEDKSAAVYVSAEEGVFPEGTTVTAKRIDGTAKEYDQVEKSLNSEIAKSNKDVLDFVAYDITFHDVEGNEIEPEGEVQVSLDFHDMELGGASKEDSTVSVIHVKDDFSTETVQSDVDLTGEQLKQVEFKAEEFSIYAVTVNGIVERYRNEIQVGDCANIEFWDKEIGGGTQEINFEDAYELSKDDIGVSIQVIINGNKRFDKKYKITSPNSSEFGDNQINMQTTVQPGEGYWLAQACRWQKANENEYSIFGGSGSTGPNKAGDKKQWNILTIYLTTDNPNKSCTSEAEGENGTKDILVDLYNYNTDIYNEYVGLDSDSLLLRSAWGNYKADYYENIGGAWNISCGKTGICYGLASMTNENIQFAKKAAFFDTAFDTAKAIRDIGKKYSDVNFKFLYNEDTNEYSYNSEENHVHFDKSTKTITQYNGSGPKTLSDGTDFQKSGFFPFTDENDNMTDYGFGMRMDVDFLLNEDGTLENGEAMQFSFSGDDDVWVFIDGKLALDLGGLHSRRGGTINFQTKKVTYDQVQNENGQFVEPTPVNGSRPDTTFLQDLKPGTHTLTMYYLERGGNDSNCEIKFNLLVVNRQGTLDFMKQDGEEKPLEGAVFGLYKTEGDVENENSIQEARSDANGEVTFDISNLQEGTYFLKEIAAPFGYIADSDTYKVIVTETEKGTDIIVKGEIKDGKNNLVTTITNQKQTTGGGTTAVTVKKEWGEEVKPDQKVPVTVTLKSNNQTVPVDIAIENPVTLDDPDWAHTWSDLPGSIEYTVEEAPVAGFSATNDTTSSYIINSGFNKYSLESIKEFELGGNGIIIVKKGNGATIWTDKYISDEDDRKNIIEALKKNDIVQKGIGSALNNSDFVTGNCIIEGEGISIGYDTDTGKVTLKSNISSAKSIFWAGTYNETKTITITNNKVTETDIPVEKKWGDSVENTEKQSVEIGLYNGDTQVRTVTLTGNPDWKGVFENVPYWNEITGEKIRYTVKEISIGDKPVDKTDFQVTVTENSDGSFTVTNEKLKPWKILKVSASDITTPLKDAIFKLEKGGPNSATYYGKTGEDGIVVWYTDKDCTEANKLEGAIPIGNYQLSEIQAPSGYTVSSITWTVEVVSGGVTITEQDGDELDGKEIGGVQTFTIANEAVYSLPSSGGPGIFWYTISGALLLMAGTLILYNLKKGEVLKK